MDEIEVAARPPRRLSFGRIVRALVKLFFWFVVLSIIWVGVYRFVSPPVTFTMIANAIDGRGIEKNWMALSRMDPSIARAAIAGEDNYFCTHKGFDFTSIHKAIDDDVRGAPLRGGSTISQQTAKNVFLWQHRSWLRKGLETWFTMLIELLWGKRRIMEMYLNVAETGDGIYGVNAAAMRYFHHDASRMSPIEAARLIAVFPLPKKRSAVAPAGDLRLYGDGIAAQERVVAGKVTDACMRYAARPRS